MPIIYHQKKLGNLKRGNLKLGNLKLGNLKRGNQQIKSGNKVTHNDNDQVNFAFGAFSAFGLSLIANNDDNNNDDV